MNADFVRARITTLRIKKGVSEYQMSYALGHSRGYMYNISSGKSLPPLLEFFSICEYLDITPSEFFNTTHENPEMIRKAVDAMENLDDKDMLLVLNLIRRLRCP